MKQTLKRISLGILAGLSLFTALLAVLPTTVHAAGENYKWLDFNTIEISGGDITQGTVYKLVQGSNPEKFSAEKFPKHEVGCSLSMFLNLTGPNSATIAAPIPKPPTSPSIGDPSVTYCHDVKYKEVCTGIWPFRDCHFEYDGARYPGIAEGYNGKSISIQGTRPGSGNQSETDIDKGVGVTINAPNPASSSPPSITVQIKDAAGNVVQTATPPQEAALGSDDPNHQNFIEPDFRPVHYYHNFLLNPGKYTVCANIVIPDCKAFEKKAFEPLFLEYGETSNERSVIAKISVGYAGGPQDMTVGPLEVTLRKADGSIITVKTNTREHKMSNEEEQANGLITVNYTFGLEGEFKGMEPGTYEVCIVGHDECKNVTKQAGENAIVEFTIDWNRFSSDDGEEKDCKEKYEVMGTYAITFMVCSIIDTGTYAIGQLDSAIASLLTIDVKDVFSDTDMSNAFHVAWNSFRFFALGLLVIAALVMVVSQAAGLEIIDAYTVRKVLPRLLFATLFITLSWDIMEFLTQLSNDAGLGIRSLIYAPFKDMADLGANIGGGSILVLTLIGTGGALAFGFIGLLSFVVTGLLASLVAVGVLVFRKILIILLVMMAPFAIAAYVLPNTQKLWGMWKSAFFAVLIVFPIIMAFIAIGRVMAVVALNAPGSPTVNQLIAIVAYFAPYFLITTAFRMAGGVIATVGGIANDKTRGAFDRLKNFRGNKVNENMQKMGSGTRFQGNNAVAKAFNATTANATTFAKSNSKFGLVNPFQSNAKRAQLWEKVSQQQRSLNAVKYGKTDRAKVAEENEPLLWAQTYSNERKARDNMAMDWGLMEENTSGTGEYYKDANGNFQRAVGGGGTHDADTKSVESAIAAAKANGGFGRDQQVFAANRLFATGTGYEDLQQVHKTVARVAGKNRELASAILGYGNAEAGGTNRLDLKAGFGEHMKLYDTMIADGEVTAARMNKATMEAVKGNDAVSMMRGRPQVMENVLPAITQALEEARITAANPNAGYDDQGRSLQDLAKEESGRLTGIIQQYQNAGTYAAPKAIQRMDEATLQPTAALRESVQQEASKTVLVRNPATGQMEPNILTDPVTGQQIPQPNVRRSPETARGLDQQAPRFGRRED